MITIGLVLCLALVAARFVDRPRGVQSQPRFFRNRIDHFNPFDRRTFEQRYYINTAFAKKDARVAIIEIGGESEITSAPGGDPEKPDILGDIAEMYGANIFVLEHRFYGASHPFPVGDKYNVSAEALEYLTSRQAQADLLSFIAAKDTELCPDSEFLAQGMIGRLCLQWIVVGGSYPGAVTGWAYQHFPHVFAAGLSSSGVVDAKYLLPEFDTHTLTVAYSPCREALYQAHHELERLIREEGPASKVYSRLGIRSDADQNDIFYYLADTMLMCFQYGHMNQCCDEYLVPAWTDHKDVVDAALDYLQEVSTFSSYDSKNIGATEVSHGDAFRQWWWQTCTEVAYYQPAPAFNSLRASSITEEWHLDMCYRAFNGLNIGDPTQRTNEYNGGMDIVADDIFFSNFWQDVWHYCGLTMAGQENVGFITCRDCGHCVDLHAPRNTDPPELNDLRIRIKDFIVTRVDDFLTRE